MDEQDTVEEVIAGLTRIAGAWEVKSIRLACARAEELIRAQAEEIERPKAQSKPTRAEVEDELWVRIEDTWDGDVTPRKIASVVVDYLASKGMVEDDKPADLLKDSDDRDEIDGVTVTEDDPLKVGEHASSRSIAKAHNALVDEVRRESKMNYETYAESIEDHSERIALLEQQKTERVPVWPRLPAQYDSTQPMTLFFLQELARIRAHLGVKEAE